MKIPKIYNTFSELNSDVGFDPSKSETQTCINGKWVLARPERFDCGIIFNLVDRLQCAWLAFSGKADLFRWPEGQ